MRRTGRGDASRIFIMQYHATIGVFGFDVFGAPLEAADTTLLKGVSMDTAKRKAHQRAIRLGYKADGAWHAATLNYATRDYRTQTGARRLIVVERS